MSEAVEPGANLVEIEVRVPGDLFDHLYSKGVRFRERDFEAVITPCGRAERIRKRCVFVFRFRHCFVRDGCRFRYLCAF